MKREKILTVIVGVFLTSLMFFIASCSEESKPEVEQVYVETEFANDEGDYGDGVEIIPEAPVESQKQQQVNVKLRDDSAIRRDLDVGSACILRNGKAATLIDKTDSTFTFLYFNYEDFLIIKPFTISTEAGYSIVKRIEANIDGQQHMNNITANLGIGRDCILRENKRSGGEYWVLIIDITDTYVEFLIQDTGNTFRVSKESAPHILLKIRTVGETS